jgi:hypothetical protein
MNPLTQTTVMFLSPLSTLPLDCAKGLARLLTRTPSPAPLAWASPWLPHTARGARSALGYLSSQAFQEYNIPQWPALARHTVCGSWLKFQRRLSRSRPA